MIATAENMTENFRIYNKMYFEGKLPLPKFMSCTLIGRVDVLRYRGSSLNYSGANYWLCYIYN